MSCNPIPQPTPQMEPASDGCTACGHDFDRHFKWCRWFKQEPMRAGDMDIIGALFAIKFIDGCGENGCAELYIEDDEFYHPKCVFSRLWLGDLKRVAEKALVAATEEKNDEQ